MKNHALMHLIGCALPLLLIFLLPAFGVSEDALFFIFIVLMFLCHLGMLAGHGHGHGQGQEEHKDGEEKGHGCH